MNCNQKIIQNRELRFKVFSSTSDFQAFVLISNMVSYIHKFDNYLDDVKSKFAYQTKKFCNIFYTTMI